MEDIPEHLGQKFSTVLLNTLAGKPLPRTLAAAEEWHYNLHPAPLFSQHSLLYSRSEGSSIAEQEGRYGRPSGLMDSPWASVSGSYALSPCGFSTCLRQLGSAPMLLPLVARSRTPAQLVSALRLLASALLTRESASIMEGRRGHEALAAILQV